MKIIPSVVLTFTLIVTASTAHADRFAVPKNQLYQEECASCHMAYAPQMLDAASWREVMRNLARHFGSDASVDEPRRLAIADFLAQHAGSRKVGVTADSRGKPLLRISETAYFVREHRDIAPAVFQRPSIKSPANCTACHTGAADGNYSEHAVRIPK